MAQYGREKIKVTDRWFQNYCKPRLTNRDTAIFRFIYENRLVTSKQLAYLFFNHSKNPQKLCNSRLRKLYRLNCINRFFPAVKQGHGSAPAHICLDRAGFKALKISEYKRYKKLPMDYQHKIKVTNFRIKAYEQGWGWGQIEYNLGKTISDVAYLYNKEGKFLQSPENLDISRIIAVEIDTGTENRKTLTKKAQRYQQSKPIELLIFISNNQSRINYFLDRVFTPKHKAGCSNSKKIKFFLKKISHKLQ